MGAFLDDDFLLGTETALALYHGIAAAAPVADFHNHLPAADLAADRVYDDLAEVWLEDDHYKWRAMRRAGVDERLVTGDADPWERFAAWAATVPRLVGSPLHVWTHLELRRVFGIDLVLGPETAREIWEEAGRQLPQLSARTLLSRFGVVALATTDDPADGLDGHRRLRGETGPLVVPTFRPDAAHRLLGDPDAWCAWTDSLAPGIDGLDALLDALASAHERFASLGARASDHGLAVLPDRDPDPAQADAAIRRVRGGEPAAPAGRDAVALEVVRLCARLAAESDGVLQLHLGALRDASPRVLEAAGRDAGADATGDERHAPGLARLLGGLERDGILPRTVLYNLHPAADAVFATLAGAFSRPGVPDLVQWGPPWWFDDHEDGIRRRLGELARAGLLAGFVGMVTDSRSLLSMTRHELFRRVLCDVLGRDAESGRIPRDLDLLGALTRGICVDNALRFFEP